MKKSRTLLLVFSLVILAFNTPALAQMGGMHEDKAPHGNMGSKKEGDGGACWMKSLTDEQKAKAAKMRLEYKKVKSLIKAQIKVKKVELVTLVTEDSPDQSAIDKKIDEILALKKQKMQKKYAYKIALRNMLTPEHRVSFDMNLLKKSLHGKVHEAKKKHGYR